MSAEQPFRETYFNAVADAPPAKRCTSWWGHDFEGRWDNLYEPVAVGGVHVGYSISRAIYVRDVCTTCGATIERIAPPRVTP